MNQIDLQLVERDAKLAWDASPQLRAEFGRLDAFLAYQRASARGAFKVLRPTVISSAGGQVALARFDIDAPVISGAGLVVQLDGAQRGRIKGYAAVFGGVNRKGCSIERGAFSGAVNRVPLSMLWRHDSGKPIGRWDVLREDSFGLFSEGQLNLNVQAGRDAFELVRGQDVTGLSVGVSALPGGYRQEGDLLTFTKCDLLEISVCPVPGEDRARITEVKGA